MRIDLRELKSSGITLLNLKESYPSGEGTIIILGVPRSGTTMVAECLKSFNVFIGVKANNSVNEDVEIAEAIESGNNISVEEIVKKRNTKYNIWGFKRPSAFKYIDKYINFFRNPKLIIIYRDPAAIAKRNEISMQMDFLQALRLATDELSALTKFVSENTKPCMIVSYEKSLQEPRQFVDALARFCGVNPTDEQVVKALGSIENGPAAYLNESRLHFEGHLDQVKNGFAGGWARCIGQKQPQNIVIISGDEVIGRGCANLFREDLKISGKEDGYCAFDIRLSRNDLSILDVIAQISGTRFNLKKSVNK